MAQQKTSLLKTYFDELAETDGDDEFRAWLSCIFDARGELADFVASRRQGGGTGTYVDFLKGSFNFSFRVRFSNNVPDAIIRFPKPGHTTTALRDEKVANEVYVMEYLRQNTTIPLPFVYSWGLTADSPHQLGPFIIMDYVEGTLLSAILKKPTDDDQGDPILNPYIDNTKLDKVYFQIADFILQLSQLAFGRIGAISKETTSGSWSVSGRPLTYNMNELASVAHYPTSEFSTGPFDSVGTYLEYLAAEHLTHLRTQRNLAHSEDIAEKRFIARHRFMQLIPTYTVDNEGPFIPFCDDMRPSNMLVDPETLRITAILDLEFTNALPAQFSYDPPWWLLISGPEVWLERSAIDEFKALYEPRFEQFLRALECVEREKRSRQPTLSARMRDSWKTKRFWFDYAARKSFEIDDIYWATLHSGGSGIQFLEGELRAKLMEFKKMKMEQLEAYKKECRARFS